MLLPFSLVATGIYLPEKILHNNDLAAILDTNDAWIHERVGIRTRHIAADNELTSDLASKALAQALTNADWDAKDLDLLIVATTTPDLHMPATATIVQKKIGMSGGFAFDIQAVCSGFLYALNIAASMMHSLGLKKVAIIGADTMSRIVDWQDRNTCVLFGDAAGALLIESRPNTNTGILASNLYSDGQLLDILRTNGGISSGNLASKLSMQGKEVYRHAIEKMVQSVESSKQQAGVEIDFLIPHQANIRILQAVGQKLSLTADQVAIAIEDVGNVSAATIPLAWHRYWHKTQGKIIALTAAGAGFTWGSTIIRSSK